MKILVCSDGSERARKALASAAIIANATKAETTIFGIMEIEQDEPRLLTALREESRVFREQDVKLEIVTKFGDPVAEITRRTQEAVYDLVVIGAERRGAQGFFLPSTKAYSITEAIAPPVLVVPVSRPAIKRILICSGGGTYIDNAVRFTSKMAKDLSAEITLLTVTPQPPAMHGTIFRRQEDVTSLLNSNSALARNLTNRERDHRACRCHCGCADPSRNRDRSDPRRGREARLRSRGIRFVAGHAMRGAIMQLEMSRGKSSIELIDRCWSSAATFNQHLCLNSCETCSKSSVANKTTCQEYQLFNFICSVVILCREKLETNFSLQIISKPFFR